MEFSSFITTAFWNFLRWWVFVNVIASAKWQILLSLHIVFSLYFFIRHAYKLAQVNLNHMICPAVLDPFQGANYRLYACVHQAFLCPIISKLFAYIFTPAVSTNGMEGHGASQNESPTKKCLTSWEITSVGANDTQTKVQHLQNVVRLNENILGSSSEKSIGTGCDIDRNLSREAATPNRYDSNKKCQ